MVVVATVVVGISVAATVVVWASVGTSVVVASVGALVGAAVLGASVVATVVVVVVVDVVVVAIVTTTSTVVTSPKVTVAAGNDVSKAMTCATMSAAELKFSAVVLSACLKVTVCEYTYVASRRRRNSPPVTLHDSFETGCFITDAIVLPEKYYYDEYNGG